MKRFILSMLIVLSLISVSSANTFEYHEDRIIELCLDAFKEDEIAFRYYCILAEFYAMRRVNDFYNEPLMLEDFDKLDELFKKHYIPKHDTYDFIEIEREFNEWKGGNK